MASSKYHLRQAQIAASLALEESDREKVVHLQLLALEHFDKAEKAKVIKQSGRSFRKASEGHDGTARHR